jgi:dTDP-4-dehydrorhamnose reductase
MILILGAKGMLGSELMNVFGSEAVGWDREEADVTKIEDIKLKIQQLKPSVIINCVAFNDVDGAEEKKDIAFLLNEQVPANLSTLANELDITLVHFSTNYVFGNGHKYTNGTNNVENLGQYAEEDEPSPQSVYAKSKRAGELAVIKTAKKYYLIRTAVLFGKKGESELSKKSFVEIMLSLVEKQKEIKVVSDEVNSLTYVNDLAYAVKVLLSQNFPFGIYHFVNRGQASWFEFASEIFKTLEKNVKLLPVSASEFPRKALRPKKSVLINTKFIAFRSWQEALKEYLNKEV